MFSTIQASELDDSNNFLDDLRKLLADSRNFLGDSSKRAWALEKIPRPSESFSRRFWKSFLAIQASELGH